MRLGASLVFTSLCVAVTSCGSGESKMNAAELQQVKTFCQLATDLDTASNGPHGEDPAAVTDPAKMKEMYVTITGMAKKLRDDAPSEIKPDVTAMVGNLLAMDKIFSVNNYDLLEMSKNEKVRAELAEISANEDVATSASRFNKYLAAHCTK